MTPRDSNGNSEGEWDDFEELGWTEFEWEKYLREQDDVVLRYLGHYEQLEQVEGRIDRVADLMGWEERGAVSQEASEAEDSADEDLDDEDLEPYTLQRNPVFIATTALFLSLARSWERLCAVELTIPPGIAATFQSSLNRCERDALLGIQSLDLGDYTMAVSLFKRALRGLNLCLSELTRDEFLLEGALAAYRETSLPKLFDLREILLRVIRESRQEAARHSGKSEDDDGERRGGQS